MRLEEEINQDQFDDDLLKALLNVLVTADWVSRSTNRVLRPFELSKEQYNVLRILRGQHPSPASLQTIQERMISKSSNATRLVEKLRSKSLVERTVCPTNRRKVDIMITRKGLNLLKTIDPLMRENGDSMRNLSERESKTLNNLLDKLRG